MITTLFLLEFANFQVAVTRRLVVLVFKYQSQDSLFCPASQRHLVTKENATVSYTNNHYSTDETPSRWSRALLLSPRHSRPSEIHFLWRFALLSQVVSSSSDRLCFLSLLILPVFSSQFWFQWLEEHIICRENILHLQSSGSEVEHNKKAVSDWLGQSKVSREADGLALFIFHFPNKARASVVRLLQTQSSLTRVRGKAFTSSPELFCFFFWNFRLLNCQFKDLFSLSGSV